MHINPWHNLDIKTKLMIMLVSLVISLMGVSSYIVSKIIQHRLNEAQQRQMKNTSNFVQSIIKDYKKKSLNYIKLLGSDESIRAGTYYITFGGGERDQLVKRVGEIHETFDVDMIEVLDDRGVVLAGGINSNEDQDRPKNYSGLVKKALGGEVLVDLVSDITGYGIMAAGPIKNQDDVIGIVVVRIDLNNDFLKRLWELSGAYVSVIKGDKIISTNTEVLRGRSIDNKIIKEFGTGREGISSGREGIIYGEMNIDDKPFSAAYTTLISDSGYILGLMMICLDSTPTIDAINNTYKIILYLIVIASLLAIVLGSFFSNSIIYPINQGVTLAHKISEGDLTHEGFVKEDGGILGVLQDSLNAINK
ncbi:MAG: cache domain-containing protein, partial [Nitrospinae bacterium]|nr:cache domain-containing protein [Nitrospinota bacterium]